MEAMDGTMDRTVPAVLSPLPSAPQCPQWSSSPLLSSSGRIKGVRLRRVPSGSPQLPTCPLPPFPPAPVSPSPARVFSRSTCPICDRKIRKLSGNTNIDYCSRCLADIFPFNSISNDREFKEAINGFSINGRHLRKAETLRFNPLDETVKVTLADLDETIGGCKYYDEDQFGKMSRSFLTKTGKQLSMLGLNVNGLSSKKDDVETLMETLNFKFDILGFTETHLNGVSEKLATIGDYGSVTNSRKTRKWGGVAIYIRSGLAFVRRPDIEIFDEGVFESAFIEVMNKGKSFIVGVIYRPPDSDMTRFFDNLELVLDKINGKRSYLMGDFNLDLIKTDQHPATGKFLNSMNSMGLHPLISLPTRITSTTATLIDNIFTSEFLKPIKSGLLFTSISDHLPTFAIFGDTDSGFEKSPQYTLRRKMGVRNKEKFRQWADNWGSNFVVGRDSVAEDSVRFRNEFRDEYNRCFPLIKVKVRRVDMEKPWLNDAILIGKIKERNRQFALHIKETDGMTADGLVNLRQITREVNHLRRDLKKSHFARQLDEAGRNCRAAWKVLHSFIGKQCKGDTPGRTFFQDGRAISGDFHIAEAFCDFFTGVGPGLAKQVRRPPNGSFVDYLGPRSGSSAFFHPTTPREIESICQGLDVSKGPGHDGVSPQVLRYVSAEIAAPLSGLVNACLESGHFPDFLKMARITPVFKGGDSTNFGDYRPISVLSVISKVFERVIQVRLLSFFSRQGSILAGQYGFRRGHSTYMAILDMVEKIRKAWEKGEHCLGVFIDFRKAFDTVDHFILLSKLEHMGRPFLRDLFVRDHRSMVLKV